MQTPAGKAALSDAGFYATLLEHRKNYIRLSGIDYAALHYSTLFFIPEGPFLDMFRKDYEAMQTAMIYGESPDFDEMLDQLKLLNGQFRLMEEPRSLEEIIIVALQNATATDPQLPDGSIIDIAISFTGDNKSTAATVNATTTYNVQFIKRTGRLIFHGISIKS